MVAKRLIACLDVRDGSVVKGVRFEGLANAGEPAALARRYNAEGIDELVILDVTATLESRQALADTIRKVSAELFIPLAVGGGIRSDDDARAALDAGADKVAINSAALENPSLLTRLASRYGSQAVVVAVDAKRQDHRYEVFSRSATTATGRDAIEWARESVQRGAGELLVTSIDSDGTLGGYDLELLRAICESVPVPVVASGGAGRPEHLAAALEAGAQAALAASIFHDGRHTISEVKEEVNRWGLPVRR